MVGTGIVDAVAALGLVVMALTAALVVVVWRVCRSNEGLAKQLGDLSLAKPWHIFQRQKDGSLRLERSAEGGTPREREMLAEARLEKARATRQFAAGMGGDDEIVEERMNT